MHLSLTYHGRAGAGIGAGSSTAGPGRRCRRRCWWAALDVQRLRQVLGFGTVPVQGRLSAQAEASGVRPDAERRRLRASRVSAVVALTGGSIAREVIAMASTDVRACCSAQAQGYQPRSRCLLMAVDMRGGRGHAVAALRVRTADGTDGRVSAGSTCIAACWT